MTKTYTDPLTDLRTVLGIEYPRDLPEQFYCDLYYTDLLTDAYLKNAGYSEILTWSFTAGFLFGVLTESSQDHAGVHDQMLFHSGFSYGSVDGLLVGRQQTEAAEMLKNARELAAQEYIGLTYQPERWQDEPLSRTMQTLKLFFQLGFDMGVYNLFD